MCRAAVCDADPIEAILDARQHPERPIGGGGGFVAKIWPSALHAVVAVPDARRGEQLVLITEHADADRAAVASAAREAGIPEIFVPRSIARVPKVPILGTGKIDYVSASQVALSVAAAL